jgi:hypothetical protein
MATFAMALVAGVRHEHNAARRTSSTNWEGLSREARLYSLQK